MGGGGRSSLITALCSAMRTQAAHLPPPREARRLTNKCGRAKPSPACTFPVAFPSVGQSRRNLNFAPSRLGMYSRGAGKLLLLYPMDSPHLSHLLPHPPSR